MTKSIKKKKFRTHTHNYIEATLNINGQNTPSKDIKMILIDKDIRHNCLLFEIRYNI